MQNIGGGGRKRHRTLHENCIQYILNLEQLHDKVFQHSAKGV